MQSRFSPYPNEVRREAEVSGGVAYVAYSEDGPFVAHDGGVEAPARFTYVESPDGPDVPVYVVECAYDDEGLPRIDGVHVLRRPAGGREVRSVDLRRMRPLEHVVEDAWRLASRGRPVVVIADTEEAAQRRFDEELLASYTARKRTIRGLRQQARRRVGPELHAEVARVYRANLTSGAPTKAVREHFGIGPSTASLYVKRARDAGFDLEGDDRG